MYVAIRRYGLLTNEPVEQVFQGIREGFIPIIKNAPGFLAYYTLDSGDGTLTSISVFEDGAGAEKSNKLAEDWVGRSLSSALPTSPETIVGEVGAHELNLIKLGIPSSTTFVNEGKKRKGRTESSSRALQDAGYSA